MGNSRSTWTGARRPASRDIRDGPRSSEAPPRPSCPGLVVALANFPGLARFLSEVNATTLEVALVQALVEPLLHDLRGAALMRSVEQQNLVCV